MELFDFSVVICTRNRSFLLDICLNALAENESDGIVYEVLVVDNGSIDETEEIANRWKSKYSNLRYVFEPQVGLSIARNRGIKEAFSEWIVFLDDDAKASKKFIERINFLIKNYNFAGIGGVFKPWYSSPPPSWIPDAVVQSPVFRPDLGPLPIGISVPGGICAFSKVWLQKVGMFSSNLGMRGDIVGYGEENYLQDQIRNAGGEIWFDPEWMIEHYVAPYKFRMSWHIQRLKGKGRDYQTRLGRLSLFEKVFLFFRGFFAGIYLGSKNLVQLVFSKTYSWQNWVLDSFSYSLISFGRIGL